MTPVAALRKYVRPREAAERCDVCGAGLAAVHIHQFDPLTRQVRCACDGCARLPGGWKTIPRDVQALPNFEITDGEWDSLAIPISLAFFTHSTPAGRLTAYYPGPAGATESAMHFDFPELPQMRADVEALLVNRVGATREYFVVPIDECYRLVGLIRIHWRGLSGGAAVWGEVARFFDSLRQKDRLCRT